MNDTIYIYIDFLSKYYMIGIFMYIVYREFSFYGVYKKFITIIIVRSLLADR